MDENNNIITEENSENIINSYDKYLNGAATEADSMIEITEGAEQTVEVMRDTVKDVKPAAENSEAAETKQSTDADPANTSAAANPGFSGMNINPQNSFINSLPNTGSYMNGYPNAANAGGYMNAYPNTGNAGSYMNGYPNTGNAGSYTNGYPNTGSYPNAANAGGYMNAYPNAGNSGSCMNGYSGTGNAGSYTNGYPNTGSYPNSANGYSSGNPNTGSSYNSTGYSLPAGITPGNSTDNTQSQDPYNRYSHSNTDEDLFSWYKNYTNASEEELKETKEEAKKSEKPKKEKSKAGKFFTGLGLAASFGIVAAGVFIGTLFLYNKYSGGSAGKENVQVTTSATVANADNSQALNLTPSTGSNSSIATTDIVSQVSSTATDVSAVVEKCMPSIVSIKVTGTTNTIWGKYATESAGSGIIIEKTENELIIATNNHVVSDANDITITFSDESTATATIKGTDEVADLAVVAVKLTELSNDTLNAIRVATLGDSDRVKVGQMAIAIGNSLGYGQSVTVGYISAKDREVTVDSQKMVLLQTDAAINPGNSGGALINLDGEVIGINSVKYADSSVEGMGFAIPISRAQNILAELATREVLSAEERGYLGIYYNVVKSEIAESYNWPMGIYVKEVVADCAAANAGIKAGDIITKLNDSEITTDKQFIDKLSALRSGVEITLTVQRLEEGSFVEYTYNVTLGEQPKTTSSTDKKTDTDSSDKKSDGSDGSTINPYDYFNDNSGDSGNGYNTNPYGGGTDPFEYFFNP